MPSNKSITIKEQIFNQKLEIWDLYCKLRVQETIENEGDRTFKDIYLTYLRTFNVWGGVELVFWLQALVKKFRGYNKQIEQIYIFSLSKQTDSDAMKLRNLKAIAKRMGLDVTITHNKK